MPRLRIPAVLGVALMTMSLVAVVPASATAAEAQTALVIWEEGADEDRYSVSRRGEGAVSASTGGGITTTDGAFTVEPAPEQRLQIGRVELVPGGSNDGPAVALPLRDCRSTSAALLSGYLDVRAAGYDEAGRLTELAADAHLDCGDAAATVQVRLSTTITFASLSSTRISGVSFPDSTGTGSATFTNDGTVPVTPSRASAVGLSATPGVPDPVVTFDRCSATVLEPGQSCTVVVRTPPPGATVRLAVPELDALTPARAGLLPSTHRLIAVQSYARPAPVTAVSAGSTFGAVLVRWTSAPGWSSTTRSWIVDRRTGTGDWVRLTGGTSTPSWTDDRAPAHAPSIYRVTPVSYGGADPSGARESAGAVPVHGWSAPVGAISVGSVDGSPVSTGTPPTASPRYLELGDADPELPKVTVDAGVLGWTLGTTEVTGTWRSSAQDTARTPFSGTLTVARLVVHADGYPAEMAALLTGSRTEEDRTLPVRALVLVQSVPTGLAAYLVAEPGKLTVPMPSGSDQSLPVTLRNLGGTPAVLDAVGVASRNAVPPEPTAWSAGRECSAVTIPPGGTCRTSVRARVPEWGRLFEYARATWTGPTGMVASVVLGPSAQTWGGAPQVGLQVPADVLDAATVQVEASDPQGELVTRHCRLDSGPFVACGAAWRLTGLQRGTHEVTAYGTDPAGNMSAWVRATFVATGVDRLAATAPDGGMYSTPSMGTGFVFHGGRLREEPAMAASAQAVYYVGVGLTGALYVRTDSLGWRALSPAGMRCSGPSAAVVGSTLAVACRGENGRLQVGKAALVPGRLPVISRFVDRGGALAYGTSTGVRAGAFTYTVVGTDHALYETGDAGGFRRLPGPLRCFGTPARDSFTSLGLACRASSGALQVLRDRTTGTYDTIPGQLVGRPGLAVEPGGSARYYVLGTNGKIYVATDTPTARATGFRATGNSLWLYGVSAGHLATPK